MQIQDNYLIISNNINNLKQLLSVLSEFEYKPDSKIDILLKENYYKEDIEKLLSCFAYLTQINYSNHYFRLFISDKNTYIAFQKSLNELGLEKGMQVYKFIEVLTSDLMGIEGILLNKYIYRAIINIKEDRVEMFYNVDNFKDKISIK